MSQMLERNLGCAIEEAGEVYFSMLNRTLQGNPKNTEFEYVSEMFKLLPAVRQCMNDEQWGTSGGGKGYFIVRKNVKEIRSTTEWVKTLIRKTRAGVSIVYDKQARKVKNLKLSTVHSTHLLDLTPNLSRWYVDDVIPKAREVFAKARASLGEYWDEQFKHVWEIEQDECKGLEPYIPDDDVMLMGDNDPPLHEPVLCANDEEEKEEEEQDEDEDDCDKRSLNEVKEWEWEKITGHREVDGQKEVRVKWKGSYEETWESESIFEGNETWLDWYYHEQEEKNKKSNKSRRRKKKRRKDSDGQWRAGVDGD